MQFLDLEHSPWNRSGHTYYLALDMCQGENDTMRVSQPVWVTEDPGNQFSPSNTSRTLTDQEAHGGRNEALRKRSSEGKETTDQTCRAGKRNIEKQV